MILSEPEIIEILKHNPNGAFIKAARDKYKLLNMHLTGEGLCDHIKSMPLPGIERAEVLALRTKYTKSNKDTVTRALTDMKKVYSAKGGIETYTLPKQMEDKFRKYLGNITGDMSLRKWIEKIAEKAYLADPNSLIYVEIDEHGNPYPTYKSTNSIFDYVIKNRRPEYVVFLLTQGEIAQLVNAGMITQPKRGSVVYRIVDETTDRICIREQSAKAEFTFPESASLPNYFMEVPGIVVSDIKKYNSDIYDSILDPVSELLEEFLIDGSTFNIAKKYQMFPKEWGPLIDCDKCGGDKVVNGDTCDKCKGTGRLPSMLVGDRLGIDFAGDTGKNFPTPPVGFASPEIDGVNMMVNELGRLDGLIYYTIWGTERVQKMNSPAKPAGSVEITATEKLLNTQPIHDKCKEISEWAENIHTFIADLSGQILYGSSYEGSAVVYGDNYILLSPDEYLDAYTELCATTSPQSMKDSALMKYYDAEYSNDPLAHKKYEILMKVEPFVHYDIDAVLAWDIPQIHKDMKIWFDEWLSTIDDMNIVTSTPDVLREQLQTYAITQRNIGVEQSQIVTQDGQVLNIGDEVNIKEGHEKQPEHASMVFKVMSVSDNHLSLEDPNGVTINQYTSADVIGVGVKIAA